MITLGDLSTWTGLITSVGFPIVVCIALAWYVKKQTDNYREDVKKLTEEHRSEIAEVTTALNNNTLAIQKLCTQLGGESIE